MNDVDIIDAFEETISTYAGAKYGVAVSSCTNAIFLCLQYLKYIDELKDNDKIVIPSRTYLSVPCSIKNSGLNVTFMDMDWSGLYQLWPTKIWDSAVRFTKDMYVGKNALQCISFQYRKHLKMGRGGMILTNNKKAVKWLKQARFNGRHEGTPQHKDILDFCGWNMYMLPEDAAKGLTLFNVLPEVNPDCKCQDDYPDLSKQRVFKDE